MARDERGKDDGWSLSSGSNSFIKPRPNPPSQVKSRSFNQNMPTQNARFAQHSKLSSIISHNIQSQSNYSNSLQISQAGIAYGFDQHLDDQPVGQPQKGADAAIGPINTQPHHRIMYMRSEF